LQQTRTTNTFERDRLEQLLGFITPAGLPQREREVDSVALQVRSQRQRLRQRRNRQLRRIAETNQGISRTEECLLNARVQVRTSVADVQGRLVSTQSPEARGYC